MRINKSEIARIKKKVSQIQKERSQSFRKNPYMDLPLEKIETEFDRKMSESHDPIIINGKNIDDMTLEELQFAYADMIRNTKFG